MSAPRLGRRRVVWLALALALMLNGSLMAVGTGGAASAAGNKSGPSKPKKALCSSKRKRNCIRVPASAKRPPNRGQQGGPTDVLPAGPTDGGLGGAGFSREESAISWASGLRGSVGYAWWCQRFVENAFNTQGRFASAWRAAQGLGLRAGWAPRGALVFFRPHWSNKGYGHVGISLGGTRMISALASVQDTDINASGYWRSLYAGWAPAPASWPGRDIVPNPPPNDVTTPGTTPGTGTSTPTLNRQAVTSYDQMRPGAPHHAFFLNAWQPFVAQSNTVTTLAATVGTPSLPAGQATPYQLNLRLCRNQPDVSGNCSVAGQASAQIVNYGASIADIGDIGVTKGQTYWILWFQPPPAGGQTWVTFWFGGGASIATSDEMQAFVRGYDRS